MSSPTRKQAQSRRDRDVVRDLYLHETRFTRDALPYDAEFERLRALFEERSGRRITARQFWLLLASETKHGEARTGRRMSPTTRLTKEQELELLRLFPDGPGGRDTLPYTREFDELLRRFNEGCGLSLSRGEFWRCVSCAAKRRRKPSPRAAPLFPDAGFTETLERDLRAINPWWEGKPGPELPPFRRWVFHAVRSRMAMRLAPIVAVRGPRRVGKTVVQQQIISELLRTGVEPRRILRVQFDELPSLGLLSEPVLGIVGWFQARVLGQTLNEAARSGRPAFLFLDEVQNLRGWDAELKFLVDHNDVTVCVTGSLSLRIGLGRDSLAGRITQLDLGPLRLSEVAEFRRVGPLPPFARPNGNGDLARAEFWHELVKHAQVNSEALSRAFACFAERGGFPEIQEKPQVPWPDAADQLANMVVRRTIQHDLRAQPRTRRRDPQVLEAVFRSACRHTGQVVRTDTTAEHIGEVLGSPVRPEAVRVCLDFLEESMLLRLVKPLELRLKKPRTPDKICVCDHGLRAAWLQEVVPLIPVELDASPAQADLAGHIIEGIVGHFLGTMPGVQLAHFPERKHEPEVDFVVIVGRHRIPVEVKYRRNITKHDMAGLLHFVNKKVYDAPFGLLLTREDSACVPEEGIIQVPVPAALLIA